MGLLQARLANRELRRYVVIYPQALMYGGLDTAPLQDSARAVPASLQSYSVLSRP